MSPRISSYVSSFSQKRPRTYQLSFPKRRMEADPFYPPYEKLSLNLSGKYSRRITIRDRLVYEIRQADDCRGVVFVLRMKGHYKGIHALLSL